MKRFAKKTLIYALSWCLLSNSVYANELPAQADVPEASEIVTEADYDVTEVTLWDEISEITADDSVEVIMEESNEISDEEVIEEAAEVSADEAVVEDSAEVVIEETAEVPVDEAVAEDSVEEVIEEAVEVPADEVIVEDSVEEVIAEDSEVPADEIIVETPADETIEIPTEEVNTEAPVEEVIEDAPEVSTEETIVEVPVEETIEEVPAVDITETETVTDTQVQAPALAGSVQPPSIEVKGTFGGRNVTVTSPTAGAKIYYSTTTSSLTTGDKSVANGGTIPFTNFYGTVYFKAYKDGVWSNVARLVLKIPTINDPVIKVEGDKATLTTTTPECYFVYTMDGTTPSLTNGTRIKGSTSQITVKYGTTLKVMAIRSCFTNSNVVSQSITMSAPSFAVVGKIGGREVTFKCASPGVKIYYSTTTSNLTTGDKCVENGGKVFFEDYYGTLYARAYADGKWSNVSRLILRIPVVNDPEITRNATGVTIKTTTPLAGLIYTTDGSVPSITNGTYTDASSINVNVSSTLTVRAIAVRSCFTNSKCVSYTYVPEVDEKQFISGISADKIYGTSHTKRWASPKSSFLYEYDGKLYVVTVAENVEIVVYDANTHAYVGRQTVNKELALWGGFYSGKTYNYMVFGQQNKEESDAFEVIRVVKYDKNFKRISACSVKEAYTHIPFDAGSCSMAEYGNELVVHTARERYLTDDGYHHQSQLTIFIDTTTMKATNYLGRFQDNHVSHSFNQFAIFDGDDLILLDHGDAYPRCVTLSKRVGDYYQTISMMDIPGSIGANCTGVYLNGLEASSTSYLATINSIDHSKVTNYTSFEMEGLEKDERNAVLLVVPKSNFSTTAAKKIYLTDYVGKGYTASAPYLVKINDNKFAVIWEEFKLETVYVTYPAGYEQYNYSYDTVNDKGVKYVIVDGNGKLLSDVMYKPYMVLSRDCQPIYTNGVITWYVNSTTDQSAPKLTFYSLDV